MSMAGPDIEKVLAELRLLPDSGDASGCPEDSSWLQVVAGIASPAQEKQLLDHAIQCRRCAQSLSDALDIMLEPASAAEAPHIRTVLPEFLQSGPLGPTRDLAAMPGAKPNYTRNRRSSFGARWAWALSGVAACAVAAYLALPWYSLRHAGNLVARAELVSRGSELRFSGEPWGPLSATRSLATDGEIDQLDIADAKRWLLYAGDSARARSIAGRLAAAERDPDAAVASFQKAVASDPNNPGHLNDLAAALATRAIARHDPASAQRALAILDRALGLAPRYSPALFNRALTLGFLGRRAEACTTLQEFLSIETDARWKREARAHLAC